MVGPKRSVRLSTPLDPDPEPADREPLITANASAEPPFEARRSRSTDHACAMSRPDGA